MNPLQMLTNRGPEVALNNHARGWVEADEAMRKITQDYTVPYENLSDGLKSWAVQMIASINSEAGVLGQLGYDTTINVIARAHKPLAQFIEATMNYMNEVQKADPSVDQYLRELKADQEAATQKAVEEQNAKAAGKAA